MSLALCDETKIFTDKDINTFFPRPNFPIPIPRLFFQDQIFQNQYRDFFNETKYFDIDTETFFNTNIETKMKIFIGLETETETETFAYD